MILCICTGNDVIDNHSFNCTVVKLWGFSLSYVASFFVSVTGASRGYAFVEYETEKEMRCAYKVLLQINENEKLMHV